MGPLKMDLSGKGSEGILQISDKKWKGSMGVSAKNDVTTQKKIASF